MLRCISLDLSHLLVQACAWIWSELGTFHGWPGKSNRHISDIMSLTSKTLDLSLMRPGDLKRSVRSFGWTRLHCRVATEQAALLYFEPRLIAWLTVCCSPNSFKAKDRQTQTLQSGKRHPQLQILSIYIHKANPIGLCLFHWHCVSGKLVTDHVFAAALVREEERFDDNWGKLVNSLWVLLQYLLWQIASCSDGPFQPSWLCCQGTVEIKTQVQIK